MPYVQYLLSIMLLLTTFAYAEQREVRLADLVVEEGIARVSSEQEPFTGMAVAYYDNGQRETQIPYQAGLRQGNEIAWYDNGELRYIVRYVDGAPQSLGSSWYLRSDAVSLQPPAELALCGEDIDNPEICGQAQAPRTQLASCAEMENGSAVCGEALTRQSSTLVNCADRPESDVLCSALPQPQPATLRFDAEN